MQIKDHIFTTLKFCLETLESSSQLIEVINTIFTVINICILLLCFVSSNSDIALKKKNAGPSVKAYGTPLETTTTQLATSLILSNALLTSRKNLTGELLASTNLRGIYRGTEVSFSRLPLNEYSCSSVSVGGWLQDP